MNEIKGIVYDLDGTIIMTQALHNDAWIFAANKLNINLSKEMLFNQRGVSNEAAALMMLSSDKKHLSSQLIFEKINYVNEHADHITLFEGIEEVLSQLHKEGYKIYIFTSAGKDFTEKVLSNFNGFKEINIIWREMYANEKSSPDGLYLTMRKMGLKNSDICYIGDALSDYETSSNAGVRFIYFAPNLDNRDSRIPESVPIISFHKDLFKLLPSF